MANDLLVRILGDTKGLERSFARANQTTTQFGRSVETTGAKIDKTTRSIKGFATGAAAGFAGAFVTTEILGQMRSAITVASNLQEQISKTRQVFEDSSGEIESWAKTTADGIGIARDEALAAASTFGSMFDAAGRSSEDAADLSKAVVQLAADLASFNNTSVEDALTALRSGLSGEIEPLRRFQVFLTEAAVAAEAMAETSKSSAQELTQGEKIMARWNLILQQTTKQQGDFARTSEGLANQQRKLNAQIRDLQANVGGPLLRVITSLVEDMNSASRASSQLVTDLRRLGNIDVPLIDIPLNIKLLFGGKDAGSGQAETAIKTLLTGSLPGILGLLNDAVRGQGAFGPGPKPNENELSKEFEKNFTPFLDGLEKGAKAARDGVKKTAGRVAAFGEAGFKPLLQSLRQIREARQKAEEAAAKIAQDRRDDAAEKLIAGLQLGIDRAELTRSLRDDVAALEALKAGLQGLIRQGQDVQDNQARLVATIGAIAEKRAEIAQAAQDAIQGRQFRALGLTAEGGDLIPGVENLRKQLQQLAERIGTREVGSKIRSQLKGIGRVLSGELGAVTDDVRSKIRDLLQAIRGGLEDLSKTGPLTKTTSLNTNKLLDGLGLGRDMEKELRARLSSFNSAGQALARGGARPTGQFVSAATIVVENHNTTTLDGDVVGRNVTRSQQKAGRRNPRQKRGPNSGI